MSDGGGEGNWFTFLQDRELFSTWGRSGGTSKVKLSNLFPSVLCKAEGALYIKRQNKTKRNKTKTKQYHTLAYNSETGGYVFLRTSPISQNIQHLSDIL